MARTFDTITPEIAGWIAQQHVFLVASAPLSGNGHVNCSPKGMDAFRIFGPLEIAYVDLTGSGSETIAHLKENGRCVELRRRFPDYIGTRALVTVRVTLVSDSCGFAVPRLDFVEERDALERWAEKKGPEGLRQYRRERNSRSIDGLPALSQEPEPT